MINAINELQLKSMCKKYKIKHKIFPNTGIILLDSGLDEWQVKYDKTKNKPFCLLHKNKCRRGSRYHIQRNLRTLKQLIDCIVSHKKVLAKLYGSPNTYKNKKINRKEKYYC